MNEGCVDAGKGALLKRPPPLGKLNFDDTSTKSFDCFDLRLRRRLGRDNRAGNAKLTRPPGYSLRHVTCRCSQHSARQYLRLDMAHRMRRTADFKRADRLQVFELEVNLCGRFFKAKPNERCSDRGTRNPSASFVYFGKRRHLYHVQLP